MGDIWENFCVSCYVDGNRARGVMCRDCWRSTESRSVWLLVEAFNGDFAGGASWVVSVHRTEAGAVSAREAREAKRDPGDNVSSEIQEWSLE
jgi:hypothetical protein